MFVGHALFAFAVAALVADRWGWHRRQALAVGIVAGAFATLPDVDVAYAFVGLLRWITTDGALSAPTAFWDASRATHRSVTHSLVTGAIAAASFALLARSLTADRSVPAIGGSLGLVAILLALAIGAGPLAGAMMALFLATGWVLTRLATHRTTLSAPTIGLAALWGLWSHPWGDLFTGEPPAFAFPIETAFVDSRVVISGDPTLHLLGAFAIELATVWLALLALYRLTDRAVIPAIDRRATVGSLYGVTALVATPPTLAVSYHFVYSILGVGFLFGAIKTAPLPSQVRLPIRSSLGPSIPGSRSAALDRLTGRTLADRLGDGSWLSNDDVLDGALTAVAAVTVALATYGVSYVLVVGPS
ncbi:metal-dependent hydrolase [Halovivax cerinus]|uniref:Metal-dependent hydrolase n=1 Tax=Halovivax cerinus TaxID=1487865 RepID=A0ABD5NSI2_9EURY|nr:metal-dependent hydrolase [Halovivax cerinus]